MRLTQITAEGKSPHKKGTKKYNAHMAAVHAESISAMNKEDPNNPEVLIQGFGRLSLSQIEDSVIGKFKDLAKRSERRDPMEWDQIGRLLETSTLKPMVDAINDTYTELEKIRKAGGPKSRGIKPGYSNPLRD
jgi:hypothetical protein|tara:strand:- start:86 stop:484 length:399 start_codon:yes stop_codon:yes gene_type:complete